MDLVKLLNPFIFPDLDFNKTVEGSISNDVSLPSWTNIISGLNFAAICSNNDCPSKKYKYYTWIPKGKGSFNIAHIFCFEKGVNCTACKKFISAKPPKEDGTSPIKGLCFFNCNYKYQGAKITKRGEELAKMENIVRYDHQKSVYGKKTHDYFSQDWTIWATLQITTY